jgi:hypothetical protein
VPSIYLRPHSCITFCPHPEEAAPRPSRRMAVSPRVASILRDAANRPLLRMRSEIASQSDVFGHLARAWDRLTVIAATTQRTSRGLRVLERLSLGVARIIL